MKFLGSSGQSVDDISKFIDMTDKTEIDILASTLEMRHIAPTCPDTLRSFPFEGTDPLVLGNSPNVYFSCNTKEFETKIESGIRLVTVPTFTKNKEIVLVDVDTLEAYSYQIQIPSLDK
jgi:DNA polymerase delta subunit 2